MDTTPIENAQSEATFDVLAFIEGTAYPTETVALFQDAKSADEYVKTAFERKKVESSADTDLVKKKLLKPIDEKLAALTEKIRNSSIVFEVRGMPPGILNKLLEIPKDEEDADAGALLRENIVIAKSIISVKNAFGKVDTRLWDADAVSKVRSFLKEGEFGKLIAAVANVNFNAAVFDQATDAGFSRTSSDVA